MTAVSAEPSTGRWARLGVAVLSVFALQVALLFWLSDRSPVIVRPARPAPEIRPGNRVRTTMLVEDPTLFVLPRPESFSGPAWLELPHPAFRANTETEPPRPLRLEVADLGAEFVRFTRTNAAPRFEIAELPEPVVVAPEIPAPTPISSPSTLRIEGDLAGRRLLSKFELRSWPSADLLTNSVVEVLVDARGDTLYAVLLSPCGNTNADPFAVQLAKAARFEPVKPENAGTAARFKGPLAVGRLIFQWQTLPPTNGTAAGPVAP